MLTTAELEKYKKEVDTQLTALVMTDFAFLDDITTLKASIAVLLSFMHVGGLVKPEEFQQVLTVVRAEMEKELKEKKTT